MFTPHMRSRALNAQCEWEQTRNELLGVGVDSSVGSVGSGGCNSLCDDMGKIEGNSKSQSQSQSESNHSSSTNSSNNNSTTVNIAKNTITRLQIVSRWILHLCIALLLCYRSIPVVYNLISSKQSMNSSYDSYRLVNTYGAFGSITRIRREVILQRAYIHPVTGYTPSTHTNTPNTPNAADVVWVDVEFKCKPGDINKQPCFISPYHYRLDWLMWFAAFQSYQQNPWIIGLASRLVSNSSNGSSGHSSSNNSSSGSGHTNKYEEYEYNNGVDGVDGLYQLLAAQDHTIMYDNTTVFYNHIRGCLYEYEYNAGFGSGSVGGIDTDSVGTGSSVGNGNDGWEVGKWWKRRYVSEYFPVITADNPSVQAFLKHYQ